MAKFIRFTEDRGIGKQTVYVNVDQIATARLDPETDVLELEIVGAGDRVQVHGEEAKAAAETIKALV